MPIEFTPTPNEADVSVGPTFTRCSYASCRQLSARHEHSAFSESARTRKLHLPHGNKSLGFSTLTDIKTKERRWLANIKECKCTVRAPRGYGECAEMKSGLVPQTFASYNENSGYTTFFFINYNDYDSTRLH